MVSYSFVAILYNRNTNLFRIVRHSEIAALQAIKSIVVSSNNLPHKLSNNSVSTSATFRRLNPLNDVSRVTQS